jgi:hypothetical protein
MNLFCSHVSVRVRFVAAIAALVGVQAANAQNRITWAADASVGGNHVTGGEFIYRSNSVAEIAASVRKDVRHGVGLDAEVGYDWSLDMHNELVCALDSRGNCIPGAPAITGPVGLVGVTWSAADVVELRVNAGLIAYNVNNMRLGAPVTAIDVALAPKSWLAIVAGGRLLALPNYPGNRLTITTRRLGLRLQTRH